MSNKDQGKNVWGQRPKDIQGNRKGRDGLGNQKKDGQGKDQDKKDNVWGS